MDHTAEAVLIPVLLPQDGGDAEGSSRTDTSLFQEVPQVTAEDHGKVFVEPVRRLQRTLSEVLDVEGAPARAPEEALSLLKDAIDTFQEESSSWL